MFFNRSPNSLEFFTHDFLTEILLDSFKSYFRRG